MLEADTDKIGMNALARAHHVMGLAQALCEKVRGLGNPQNWAIAKLVHDVENHLQHVETDLKALQFMYEAIAQRAQK